MGQKRYVARKMNCLVPSTRCIKYIASQCSQVIVERSRRWYINKANITISSNVRISNQFHEVDVKLFYMHKLLT